MVYWCQAKGGAGFDTLITSTSKNKDIRQIRKQVGLVFQFAENQIFEETVLKDVALDRKILEFLKKMRSRLRVEKLALVGIDESLFDRSPFELSGWTNETCGHCRHTCHGTSHISLR